jgi:hypothetical protein
MIKRRAARLFANMHRTKRVENSAQKSLDKVLQRRGPKPTVVPSALKGRSDSWRGILDRIWNEIESPLLAARSETDVVNAFNVAVRGGTEFQPRSAIILKVILDPNFPKMRKARINFLADSCAGLGIVTPRRSRDICAAERKRMKGEHHILQYEYYVVCSCGYRGPSANHACAKCGAAVPSELGIMNRF